MWLVYKTFDWGKPLIRLQSDRLTIMARFDSIEWGTVKVDGREYDYDVVVTPKGELKPRTNERDKFGSHSSAKKNWRDSTKMAPKS